MARRARSTRTRRSTRRSTRRRQRGGEATNTGNPYSNLSLAECINAIKQKVSNPVHQMAKIQALCNEGNTYNGMSNGMPAVNNTMSNKISNGNIMMPAVRSMTPTRKNVARSAYMPMKPRRRL